jgi:prophage regulatory protein
MRKMSEWLRLPAVRAEVQLGPTKLYEMIATGEFPAPIKVGRLSMWDRSEIELWKEKQKQKRAMAAGSDEAA